MVVKDEIKYLEWKNKDDYGSAVFRYAESWADLMEKEIEKGFKVSDVAERLSVEADIECVTGVMQEVATTILCKCWIYGDELLNWINKGGAY